MELLFIPLAFALLANSDLTRGDDDVDPEHYNGPHFDSAGQTGTNHPLHVIEGFNPDHAFPDSTIATPLPPFDTWQPCGGGYNCEWMDLTTEHLISGNTEPGIKFRIVRSIQAVHNPPLMLFFPGTATCYTGEPEPSTLMLRAADAGVVVAALSLRGHVECYKPGDPLYRASTWIGPDEMVDYDRTIWAFLNGWISDRVEPINPQFIGMTGGSHGGMSAMYYGRHTRIPRKTGNRLALWMSSGAEPDVAGWFLPGYDPSEVEPETFGAIRLSGFPGQTMSYEGDYLDELVERIEGGNEPPGAFAAEMSFRSIHNLDGSVSSLLSNVTHGLSFMSSQDCIIPKTNSFELYLQIRNAGAADRFRLASPVTYHKCKQLDPDGFSLPPNLENGGDRGYYPRWTDESKEEMVQWGEDIRFKWIQTFLLDEPSFVLEDMPDWLFMLADEVNEPDESPTVYQSEPPGEAPTSTLTYYLDAAGKLLLIPPAEQQTWSITHVSNPACPGLNMRSPCEPSGTKE